MSSKVSVVPIVCEEQEFILRCGHVPARKSKRIHRKALMGELFKKIKELGILQKENWLVIRGMPGCGKSQLLVDVLWEWPELVFAHFEKIFWIDDRNADPEHLVDVVMDALILVSNSIDEEKTPATLSSIGTKFCTALNEFDCKSSKILLILDGVILPETVRFFQHYGTKNCCFVATSTSKDIFDVLGEEVSEFICNNIIDETELVLMASDYALNITLGQAKSLLKFSGGNLAILDKIFQIAQGDVQMLPSLLHRLKFRPLKELSKLSKYQYPSMDIPLRICFKMLNEDIAGKFDYWTVFEPFKWTSLEVLSLCWPLDVSGYEPEVIIQGMLLQDLNILVVNSLLDKSDDQSGGDIFYRIHPLVRSFLLHNRSEYFQFRKSMDLLLERLEEHGRYNKRIRQFYDENVDYLRAADNAFSTILKQKAISSSNSSAQHSAIVPKADKGLFFKFYFFFVSFMRRLLNMF